jgi:hypothetical protein
MIRNHHVAVTVALGFAMLAIAPAQASTVEQAATLGGRIIGAAKACGLNPERVRKVSERLLFVVSGKAASAEEREAAKTLFAAAQREGADQVRYERSKCSETHVSFSEIEVKLGRPPGADTDAVAIKRGIPALGALKTDTGTGNTRQ